MSSRAPARPPPLLGSHLGQAAMTVGNATGTQEAWAGDAAPQLPAQPQPQQPRMHQGQTRG